MSYNGVDLDSLKNTINNCLNSINYNSSSNIIESLNSDAYWNASTKTNFKNSLSSLVDIKYDNLKKVLKEALEKINTLEHNQEIQYQIDNYDGQIYNKRQDLYSLRNRYSKLRSKTTIEAEMLKKRISELENDIYYLENKRSNLQYELDN